MKETETIEVLSVIYADVLFKNERPCNSFRPSQSQPRKRNLTSDVGGTCCARVGTKPSRHPHAEGCGNMQCIFWHGSFVRLRPRSHLFINRVLARSDRACVRGNSFLAGDGLDGGESPQQLFFQETRAETDSCPHRRARHRGLQFQRLGYLGAIACCPH